MQRVLVDSNVLLAVILPDHPFREQIKLHLVDLIEQGMETVVVPQVLYEFWVVCTRPLGQGGLGLDAKEAGAEIDRVIVAARCLHDQPEGFATWQSLIKTYNLSGKESQDARLVAAMKTHGVETILTLNPTDFKRYTEITALDPRARL